MKILFLANSSYNLVNFRIGIISALLDDGHELLAATPIDKFSDILSDLGVRHVELPMDSTSNALMSNILLLARIFRLLRAESPDAVLGYTIKPNLFGALSARLLRIPFIPNVTGMGRAFDGGPLLICIVNAMYKIALGSCATIFFQNPEDKAYFVNEGLSSDVQAKVLPGSGVDLDAFQHMPLSGKGEKCTFLFVGRMLKEKGVLDFIEAAKRVVRVFPDTRFLLAGESMGKNEGVVERELSLHVSGKHIEYVGAVDDVRTILADADCVVLPSYYREGTPRSLLEAAAMGRAIITTDTPGCRDVVEDHVSGFLCKVKDPQDLASAMSSFVQLSDAQKRKMSVAARDIVVQHFDERIVISEYRSALQKLNKI